jgi:protein involved in ribonucleotide reduction
LSHQTHHHIPKLQSTKAEGEVGGGFENRLDIANKHRRNKEDIIRKYVAVCHTIKGGSGNQGMM